MDVRVAAVILCASSNLFAQQSPETARVRAEPPTVVTVRATPDQLHAREASQATKKPGVVGRLGQLAGWALNVDEDIPARRENRKPARSYSPVPASADNSAGR